MTTAPQDVARTPLPELVDRDAALLLRALDVAPIPRRDPNAPVDYERANEALGRLVLAAAAGIEHGRQIVAQKAGARDQILSAQQAADLAQGSPPRAIACVVCGSVRTKKRVRGGRVVCVHEAECAARAAARVNGAIADSSPPIGPTGS